MEIEVTVKPLLVLALVHQGVLERLVDQAELQNFEGTLFLVKIRKHFDKRDAENTILNA